MSNTHSIDFSKNFGGFETPTQTQNDFHDSFKNFGRETHTHTQTQDDFDDFDANFKLYRTIFTVVFCLVAVLIIGGIITTISCYCCAGCMLYKRYRSRQQDGSNHPTYVVSHQAHHHQAGPGDYPVQQGQVPLYPVPQGQVPLYPVPQDQVPLYPDQQGQVPLYPDQQGQVPLYPDQQGQVPLYPGQTYTSSPQIGWDKRAYMSSGDETSQGLMQWDRDKGQPMP